MEVDRTIVNRVLLATRLAARLEWELQGLPVDVVLQDQASPPSTIHDIAK